MSSSSCRWAAATTSGAACPTFSTEMPVAKSISRFPSTSSTIAPAARAVTIGWRFATPWGTAASRRANHSRDSWPRDLGDELPLLRDVHDSVLRPPASSGAVAAASPGVSCGSRRIVSRPDVPNAEGPGRHSAAGPTRWPMPSDASSLDFWVGDWTSHVVETVEAGPRSPTVIHHGRRGIERFDYLDLDAGRVSSLSVFDDGRAGARLGRLDRQLLGPPRVAPVQGSPSPYVEDVEAAKWRSGGVLDIERQIRRARARIGRMVGASLLGPFRDRS